MMMRMMMIRPLFGSWYFSFCLDSIKSLENIRLIKEIQGVRMPLPHHGVLKGPSVNSNTFGRSPARFLDALSLGYCSPFELCLSLVKRIHVMTHTAHKRDSKNIYHLVTARKRHKLKRISRLSYNPRYIYKKEDTF